jgi:hypothetical protein
MADTITSRNIDLSSWDIFYNVYSTDARMIINDELWKPWKETVVVCHEQVGLEATL